MNHRTLHRKVCPCGQAFTTSNADAIYHNKKCSAHYRVKLHGSPPAAGYGTHIKPSIEALKAFRKDDAQTWSASPRKKSSDAASLSSRPPTS